MYVRFRSPVEVSCLGSWEEHTYHGADMQTDAIRCFVLTLGALVACAGCQSTRRHPSESDAIRAVLYRQACAWNRGDVETFMDAYDRSPSLTFSSAGRVTRGWEPTLDSYRRRYPTREAMGHLTFSDLEITELGQDAVLVLGQWALDRGEPIGGIFTLVLRREAGRWVIIHDHTSRTPPD